MIQRIQSVYLLVAGIVLAFGFCVPIVTFSDKASLNASALTDISGEYISTPWGVLFFSVLSIITALYTIFSYKNRHRQIILTNVLLGFILFLCICIVAYSWAYGIKNEISFSPAYGMVLPILAYILGWLARRSIRKDEELVRAADRIR